MPEPHRDSKNASRRSTYGSAANSVNAMKDQVVAATVGNVDLLQIGMNTAGGNLKADKEGFTALHRAAQYCRLPCLQLLVEDYGVNVNLPTHSGLTPLHLVLSEKVGSQVLTCAQYLIKHGADVNVLGKDNATPLHLAAGKGLKECIVMLVGSGADLHAKDSRGFKPIDWCTIYCHLVCARFLRDAMWKKDKEDYARGMKKLEKIKEKIYEEEKDARLQIKKEEDSVCQKKFYDWIDTKGFPESLKEKFGCRADVLAESRHLHDCSKTSSNGRQHELSHSSEQSEMDLCGTNKVHRSKKTDQVQTTVKGQMRNERKHVSAKRVWNPSVNPSMTPTTKITRAPTVRLGVQPEEAKTEDLSPYVSLTKDENGNLNIKTITGRISSLPHNLPYETVKKSLFPDIIPQERVRVPQEFQAIHVFDLPKRNQPSSGRRCQSEMVFHLRQNLDPKLKIA
ncbi:ankyrin repeat domain-containing 53 [Pelobates cultripes]|uniref:Ankyrin repeat domain-containing 53 n=1 Tax=Pelobates cultripes TaxID=61616 RepID=A0AAD1SDD0_PELCU|nr:ankyrin repeat domain-containing 53 [Pelobates cultripes]